ncbi:hypothetical protein EHU68_18475 [Escherichia coli]|nr:hypothetical protein [Escherichia coli]
MNNNQGRFVFPDTWFGPLLGEFEEVLDAYDTDEISETGYINKLRRLAQQEPDFIDIHAHLAYAFLEQNAPRKALNAALKGLAAYFHERRSLNNFHRDRVITFEQIAE